MRIDAHPKPAQLWVTNTLPRCNYGPPCTHRGLGLLAHHAVAGQAGVEPLLVLHRLAQRAEAGVAHVACQPAGGQGSHAGRCMPRRQQLCAAATVALAWACQPLPTQRRHLAPVSTRCAFNLPGLASTHLLRGTATTGRSISTSVPAGRSLAATTCRPCLAEKACRQASSSADASTVGSGTNFLPCVGALGGRRRE